MGEGKEEGGRVGKEAKEKVGHGMRGDSRQGEGGEGRRGGRQGGGQARGR